MSQNSGTVHVLLGTCHLSLTPTATATNPPPANSPIIMHSRLVCKDPKTRNNFKRQKSSKRQKLKMSRGMPILVIYSLTRSLQFTGKQGFQEGTDNIVTDIVTIENWDTIFMKLSYTLCLSLFASSLKLRYFSIKGIQWIRKKVR